MHGVTCPSPSIGAEHLREKRVTHPTGPLGGIDVNTQLRGPYDKESHLLKQEYEANAGLNTRKAAEQETIAAQLDKSVKEVLQEQQENVGFDTHKDRENPQLQRAGKRNKHRPERGNVDQELTELLEDNAELQNLLKEDI